MKKLPQSNIYSASADEIGELFADYLDRPGECAALAVSERPLDDAARNAIGKSLESFGYDMETCSFVTMLAGAETESAGIPLDAQALFLLVEGLDPVCLICADSASAERLGQAYRTSYELDAPIRVFGRPAVAFRDFSALLATDEGKQRAWRILKSLPRR